MDKAVLGIRGAARRSIRTLGAHVERNATNESAAQWWGARRLRYNLALVLAGISAFIAYVVLAWSFEERLNQVEVTAFTVVFQAVGYLMAMAVANVCYFLGPLSERVVKPADLSSYRRAAYNLGLWFSVSLPFLVPAALVYVIATSGP
jgi:hypothetical protein